MRNKPPIWKRRARRRHRLELAMDRAADRKQRVSYYAAHTIPKGRHGR